MRLKDAELAWESKAWLTLFWKLPGSRIKLEGENNDTGGRDRIRLLGPEHRQEL